MSPIRHHVKDGRQRLRQIEALIQQDEQQLKQYWQRLQEIHPPKHQFNRKSKNPNERFAYYMYMTEVEDLKMNIDMTEDNLTYWKFQKEKLRGRISVMTCAV